MAYDMELEHRIDSAAPEFGSLVKKKMFGGIGYMVNGNMCFGVHKNHLVVRTTVHKAEQLLARKRVTVFDITGRPMKGWIMVESEALELNTDLLELLETGLKFALTLPSK